MKRHLLFALLTLSWVAQLMAAATISVAEARGRVMHPEEVSVSGCITFFNQVLGIACLQDESGGIAFDPRSVKRPGELPKPGDWVQVTGLVRSHQGVVMITRPASMDKGAYLIRAKAGKVPRPAWFELENAPQMRANGVLAQVSGVVRRITVPKDPGPPMSVEISTPSGFATARLPWRERKEVLDNWLNKPVRCTAVMVCRADAQMQPSDSAALLLVPGQGAWKLQEEELEEVFARPPVTSLQSITAVQRTTVANRLHLEGIVTAHKQGQWLTLRTGGGSLMVNTRQNESFKPGTNLAVACWPQLLNGELVMQDGVCRRLGSGGSPEPLVIASDMRLTGQPSAELVQVTGVVQNYSFGYGQPRLMLTLPSGESCLLQWSMFMSVDRVSAWTSGSTLAVTGVIRKMPPGVRMEVRADFSVQPRSPEDVAILSGPPWWTPERLQIATWSLLALLVIAATVVVFLRWQVRRQQRHIRLIESRAIAEEERRRIAREFHDSLQQKLVGATLHLEALQGAVHRTPDLLPRMISETTEMLRHCQVEARHCIWDLRSDAPTRESLAQTLDEWMDMRATHTGNTQLDFQMSGEMPAVLPPDAPLHLMRIAQEAVNNALAHAAPRMVQVRLDCTPQSVTLVIEDDGRGLDPTVSTVLREGHYGLSHMQERAEKMGAQLRLSPRANGGTVVTVTVQAPASRPAHVLRTE